MNFITRHLNFRVSKMLRYQADIRTLFTVAFYFAVAIPPWLLWEEMSRMQATLWVVVNCLMSFICAIIVHNSIHVPVFRMRWMNRIFQIILSFTYGHSTSAYVPGHNFSHHKYTQSPKDAIRTSKMRFRINLLNQLFFFFAMSGAILSGEIRFAKKMYRERPKWFWQYALEMGLVIGAKIVLLIVNWQCFLLFVFIPHQYAAWGIVGTNYFQHDGCDENDEYNHSRNFTGKILNWLLFNNGYHGAHHIKPGLHWSLLPEFHEKNVRPYIYPSLDQKSLLAYLIATHIYPAKRVDFKGNLIILPTPVKDVDWVPEINVRQHQGDLAGV